MQAKEDHVDMVLQRLDSGIAPMAIRQALESDGDFMSQVADDLKSDFAVELPDLIADAVTLAIIEADRQRKNT